MFPGYLPWNPYDLTSSLGWQCYLCEDDPTGVPLLIYEQHLKWYRCFGRFVRRFNSRLGSM
jgi:hypothetical protein